jgi:hypothetical protein
LAGSFFTPAQSQDPAKEEKPTFYRLIPGVYVNGWPRFTVTYPKDWVEVTPMPQEAFRAVSPGGTGDVFVVVVGPFPALFGQPLDKAADVFSGFFKVISVKDLTVVTDRPSRLSSGTPAREVELRGIMSGLPFNWSGLCVEHGDLWISAQVSSQSGKIGEYLKAILYSLQYEPSKDEPVKVPPDVQELLDSYRNAILSHDLAKVMTHYSDRFLSSGMRKGGMELFLREIAMPRFNLITSFEEIITDFIPAGNRAYVAGFAVRNRIKFPFISTSIIKENGEWKWFGNQRDVTP